jgi:hypothetical protein
MKTFTLIALLFLFGCSGEKKDQGASYDSLSAAIIDGFLTKNNWHRKTFILATNDKKSLYPGVKPSSVFNKTVRTFFTISDSAALKTLLENSSFLDTTAKIAASNVRYVTRMPPEGYDWGMLDDERILKDLLVVNFFVMLISKDGNTCVVYAHKIREGAETAVLEKNNNIWHISSIKREQPEIVE